MNYENASVKIDRKRRFDDLVELYLTSESFVEFMLNASVKYGYSVRFFDPFWRAYYGKRFPFLYYSGIIVSCMGISTLSAFICAVCMGWNWPCTFLSVFTGVLISVDQTGDSVRHIRWHEKCCQIDY